VQAAPATVGTLLPGVRRGWCSVAIGCAATVSSYRRDAGRSVSSRVTTLPPALHASVAVL
jgi:hypothetical protein